jgi:DNA-binding NarL/FixJ family response regulator
MDALAEFNKRIELIDSLPPRQLEVWKQIAMGKENKNIAFALGIAESTVKVHIRALMRKLKVSNRVKLALEYYGVDYRNPN